MTTQTGTLQLLSRTLRLIGALLALCVVASACGSADGNEATRTVETSIGAEDNNPNDLEYGDSLDDLEDAEPLEEKPTLPGFRSIEWNELLSPDASSEDAAARYEDRLAEADPNSSDLDAVYDELLEESGDPAVNEEINGESIQLAGFVAPLTFVGDDITEFLLVPYFGACIHVPPPPANQTVMVTLAEGESLSVEESWGAVWIAGELSASTTDTDLATAGYSVSAEAFGAYQST